MSSESISPRTLNCDNVEPEVFEACWRLYQRGERDLLEGGVAPVTIAGWLGMDRTTVRGACRRLVEDGTFLKLCGAAAEQGYRARFSYAPATLLEGGEARGE